MNSTLFANFESDTFSKIFKEYTLKGNDIISNFIDSIYFGGIILYRGISFKISQIFGYILLFFMIINILQIILKNVGQIDIYGIFKMIIPTFAINLFISFPKYGGYWRPADTWGKSWAVGYSPEREKYHTPCTDGSQER